jgi:hypothetical protein
MILLFFLLLLLAVFCFGIPDSHRFFGYDGSKTIPAPGEREECHHTMLVIVIQFVHHVSYKHKQYSLLLPLKNN